MEDILSPKVSWKKIGEYIWKNGGTYHFGNATCKKKWVEIQAAGSRRAGACLPLPSYYPRGGFVSGRRI